MFMSLNKDTICKCTAVAMSVYSDDDICTYVLLV